MRHTFTLLALALLAALPVAQGADPEPKLADYKPAEQVKGKITSGPSDTLDQLMTLWGDGFTKHHPGTEVWVYGKGASTTRAVLKGGKGRLGSMARRLKAEEVAELRDLWGYEPTVLVVAHEAQAVFAHKDNPLKSLTLEQIDGIFSSTRKSGGKEIKTWGDLGLEGDWKDTPIKLYGRNGASGAYPCFKERALLRGDFKDAVKEMPGSGAIIQAITEDKYAIGYSGVGYGTPNVRAVALAKKAGEKAVAPEAAAARSGEYPLSRELYVVLNLDPNKGLDPLHREFIRFVCSREGQGLVEREGFFPVTPAVATENLKKAGLGKP
jgi:phosphate transport system substrate-binding protein